MVYTMEEKFDPNKPTPLVDLYTSGPDHVEFEVPSAPRGKARPVVTRGGRHTYTPDPGDWVRDVRLIASDAVNSSGWSFTANPVSLKVRITRQIPKHTSKKKYGRMDGSSVAAIPDLVNIVAAICDAIEGVVYENDRQVARIDASRIWGKEHSTTIRVSEIIDSQINS